MSNKLKRGEQDEGYARSAWDWWQGSEMGSNVRIVFEMTRNGRKGVYKVDMRAEEVSAEKGAHTVCRVTCSWPDASGTTLAGLLHRQVLQIDRMLDDRLLDEHGLAWRDLEEG